LNFGVNVKKITNIADNIKMSLCAKSIRIEAPIPGKSNVGIEVPNPSVRTVAFAELAERDEFLNGKDKYNIVLGIDINGDPVYTSVAKMPHGLIAGTTGSGKSVCLNGLLISLLLRNSPTDLRLVLVDPKVVEFGDYQDLPHLATPVITNVKLASEALKWATEEMDRRFIAFQAAHVRDLPTYNNKVKNDPSLSPLPRIVVVIEEFADLIMTCGNDVESSIQRITQMGRAAGIHLILATQRPTTDIVKGSIKTNIQCRIAFRVVDYTASTTILGGAGAEELLGRGDMLFKVEDLPTRIQGAYISDEEIQGVCEYIRSNYKPDYLFTHEDLQNKVKDAYGANNKENSEDMELVYSVAVYVVERGSCSINSIQTTFSLGFRRASNIVDILEEMGIVGASKGTTGREILVTLAEVDQKFKVGH
jgi:S-DNA-T family DNA segregation ATPase FtsK/SpoIIIE